MLCYKDKKAAKEKEREQRIAEAELENVHSARNIEAEKLKEILTARGLSIKEVILIIWSHFSVVNVFNNIMTMMCYSFTEWICFQITPDGNWYVTPSDVIFMPYISH